MPVKLANVVLRELNTPDPDLQGMVLLATTILEMIKPGVRMEECHQNQLILQMQDYIVWIHDNNENFGYAFRREARDFAKWINSLG